MACLNRGLVLACVGSKSNGVADNGNIVLESQRSWHTHVATYRVLPACHGECPARLVPVTTGLGQYTENVPCYVASHVLFDSKSGHGLGLLNLGLRCGSRREGEGRVEGERLQRNSFCTVSGTDQVCISSPP